MYTNSLILPAAANFLAPPGNTLQRHYLEFSPDGEAERMIKSWGNDQTVADVTGPHHPGWIPPASEKGQVTCVDCMFFASDHGDGLTETYEGSTTWLRCEWRTRDLTRGFVSQSTDFVSYAHDLSASGPWTTIGKHAHWSKDLDALATSILRRVLKLEAHATFPKVPPRLPLRSLS